jgi:hypothetical protein
MSTIVSLRPLSESRESSAVTLAVGIGRLIHMRQTGSMWRMLVIERWPLAGGNQNA